MSESTVIPLSSGRANNPQRDQIRAEEDERNSDQSRRTEGLEDDQSTIQSGGFCDHQIRKLTSSEGYSEGEEGKKCSTPDLSMIFNDEGPVNSLGRVSSQGDEDGETILMNVRDMTRLQNQLVELKVTNYTLEERLVKLMMESESSIQR